jgi:hypothetical protein
VFKEFRRHCIYGHLWMFADIFVHPVRLNIYGRLGTFMDMHHMDVYGHLRTFRDIYGMIESYF